MSTRDGRTLLTRRDAVRRKPLSTGREVLLGCGIAASVLYAAGNDLLAALLYEGYSPLSQAVSELTSLGAPTRTPLVVMGFLYDALILAFGIGVRRSAGGSRALRVVGALLIAHAAVGPLWLPFPMSARGAPTPPGSLTDTMHLVLGGLTVLIMLSMVGAGAAAFGRGFRLYSVLTAVAVLGFGTWMSSYVPAVPAGEPTPWMGLAERLMIWAWLLWMVVLAVLLLRGSPARPVPGPRDSGGGG
jgi:hypothetical protein